MTSIIMTSVIMARVIMKSAFMASGIISHFYGKWHNVTCIKENKTTYDKICITLI